MVTPTINIEIEGMAELLAAFKGVEEGMIDFRQLGAWKGVQYEFYKIEKEQFATAGRAGKSGQWAALSPKYAAVKNKRFRGPTQILRAGGDLYRSLTQDEAPGSVVEMSAQEMTIGTSIPYAQYHQTGTRDRGGMPARPPISFTEEQERQLMKPIQDKLKQLIANAKLRSLRGF